MKNIISIFLLSILSGVSIFSQEYHTYAMELVFQLKYGINENQIFLKKDGEGPEPRGIGFDNEGFLYIDGSYNKYYKKFSINGDYVATINTSLTFPDAGIKTNELGFFKTGPARINVENFKGEKIIEVNFPNTVNCQNCEILLIENYCFLRDGSIIRYSIPNPGPDPEANNRKILDAAQTRELFNEPAKYGLEGVTLENGKLFVDGELQTRDYRVFYDYWRNYHGGRIPNLTKLDRTPDFFIENRFNVLYIGQDKAGSVYWDTHGGITVFTKIGEYVENFIIANKGSKLRKTSYAVHPSGDIYFLGYDTEAVYLYRIKNVWDQKGRDTWYALHGGGSDDTPQAKVGVLNDSRVRFRSQPNLSSDTLGYLNKGDRVLVLEQSAEKMQIGDMNDYWYRVRTAEGTEGWAYGAFVEME